MRQRIKIYTALFITFLFLSSSITAQTGIVSADAPVKPSLMILGSYHFANPGRDVVKSKVTDVSTPDRQRQLLEMITRLEKYRPTKIVLECDVENEATFRERFTKYLEGDYQLSVNERDQLGFRLAKDLARKQIYCVDTNTGSPGSSSDYNYVEFAAKHKEMDDFLKSWSNRLQTIGDRRDKLFQNLSITRQFIYLNDPVQVKNDHASYFDLLRLGIGTEYTGANWLTSWYGRNLKILANIIRITDSPNDRILAIYGAGHLKLLNQMATESGFYNIESPLKYLKK